MAAADVGPASLGAATAGEADRFCGLCLSPRSTVAPARITTTAAAATARWLRELRRLWRATIAARTSAVGSGPASLSSRCLSSPSPLTAGYRAISSARHTEGTSAPEPIDDTHLIADRLRPCLQGYC